MSDLDDFAANTEMRTHLREPFPPKLVSKLPSTPKRPPLDYVGHAAVTDRLNRVAPGWTYEITKFAEFEDTNGLPHVMAVYGYMKIGNVVRYEAGEADGLADYGRELKGAISDFIRRAAMRFGVALDLWAKEDLLSVGESTVEPSKGSEIVTSSSSGEDWQASGGTDASPALSVVPEGTTDAAAPGASAPGGEATDEPSPTGAAPQYLSTSEQRELIQDYGSNKKVVEAFRARFGERIQRIADITCDMVEAMDS